MASLPSGEPLAPRADGRRRRRWAVPALLLAVVLAVAGGVAAGDVWKAQQALRNVPRATGLLPSGSGTDPRPPAATPSVATSTGPLLFAIMGTDSRNPAVDPGNSDTLMLAYIPADRAHIYLISLPRDLWVRIHGAGYAKINAAYDQGGSALAVATVEDLIGVRVDHVALINFTGFIQLTDVLGGVTIDNPQAFDTQTQPDYTFPAGRITISGAQALAYVRERHHLANGDLDRTGDQRLVVQAIIGKALSAGVVANPATFQDFVTKASADVTVDDSLTDSELQGLVTSLRLSSSADVRQMMLPVGGFATSSDGQAIDVVDPTEVAALHQALATDTMDAFWAAHSADPLITGHRSPGPIPAAGS